MGFFTNRIDYLPHDIRPCRLSVLCHTVDEIWHLWPPANVTELRSFPDLCHAFKLFVQNLDRIAALLNKKLGKDEPAKFEKLTELEFLSLWILQGNLRSPPVPGLPLAEG